MNSWRKTAEALTEDFMAWGCRFSRKQLPEIAASYHCTPLFFWNWMDDPETLKTERGFLRVLGYAWRKLRAEEAESVPSTSPAEIAVRAIPCGRKAVPLKLPSGSSSKYRQTA